MRSFLLISYLFLFTVNHTLAQIAVVPKEQTSKEIIEGKELVYFHGKAFTGTIIDSYINGQPKMLRQLVNGEANGKWQEWYENGHLRFDANWKEGKGNGQWFYYYENGQVRQEEYYDMDKPVGIFREYYINGQVKLISCWLNGKKQGTWSYYSEYGSLLKTENYVDSEQLSIEE